MELVVMTHNSILVVEHNTAYRNLIAATVSRLGYLCHTASDVTLALGLLDNHHFSVIISDIRWEMDNGTGILPRVCSIIPEAPVVIMTGYSGDYSFDRVFGAGAQEFIKKPFTTEELENRLKRIFHEIRLGKENERLQQKQAELNEQLKTLLSVATDLTGELDFERLFPLIIGKITEAMSAERTSLYMIDWERRELWTRVSEGIAPIRLKLGLGISGRVAETGEVICVKDAWELPYFNRDYDRQHKFRTRAVLCMPISNRMGERFAVIQVINKRDQTHFTEKDLVLLSGLASQVGVALENALLYDEIRLFFEGFIRTLSAVVDARHPLTAGHSQRVTEYSLMIAEQMNLDPSRREVLKIAALLHDIGKIGIRDEILLKNGRFTPEERAEMNTHPTKTKEILEKFGFPKAMREIPDIALYHHEKVNGTGYPHGLKGDKMPLESRIMAVADVFDALTSPRDYPKYTRDETFDCERMPLDKVISILEGDSGSHFDPMVVETFMRCLPQVLFQFRGGHFPPEYVDDTIKKIAPELLTSIDAAK